MVTVIGRSKPLVTVITATTGAKTLKQAIESVKDQTYPYIQHLIVVDGQEHLSKVKFIKDKDNLIVLPYPTGTNNYNGHRIYGGSTFFSEGLFLSYLDEDNWFDPYHIESLVDCIDANTEKWAYSLRKIVSQSGEFICNDDCENLGRWKSVLDDHFVDVNSFLLPKLIALQLTPLWYRRARHPDDLPEVDRIISHSLFNVNSHLEYNTNYSYSVNYRVGSRIDSVKAQFFQNGNMKMLEKYKGKLPWKGITILLDTSIK
jgi:glycosyltransferase involved in cell wall biosynthesis